MTLRWTFALILCLLLPVPAAAVDQTAIEQLIQQRFASSDSPGLIVALRAGDEEPLVFAYGTAELEQGSRMQAETVLPIASITKALVGVSVLLLQQDGRLRLDDPLSRFLPDYPGAAGITLAQLLNHTAGIPDFVTIPAFADNQAKDWTPTELVALFSREPPTAPPGQECRYSDSGFVLLGLVVETASGQSFGDFVRERITGPLGMRSTAMGSNTPLLPLRARGYAGKRDAWSNVPYLSQSAPFSAGAMVSTAGDLVRLGAVLLPGSPLLQPESIAAMTASPVLAKGAKCALPLPGAAATYGLGLELVTFDVLPAHRALGKSGVFPGFGAFFAAFEDSDLSIVVIANQDNSLPLVVPLLRDLAELLLDSGQ